MYNIEEIHKDHIQWKRKLDFYRDEISFFFKELNKVFDKDKENLQRMEFIDEYEAILEKKQEQLESIYQQINDVEKSIAEGESSITLQKVHHQLSLDLHKFHRAYLKMKQGFKMFAAHNH
ncbi:MAG: hypothetical protein ACJA1A_003191 [Saprospiraceae bacterium]|jgi:hypothetical protein